MDPGENAFIFFQSYFYLNFLLQTRDYRFFPVDGYDGRHFDDASVIHFTVHPIKSKVTAAVKIVTSFDLKGIALFVNKVEPRSNGCRGTKMLPVFSGSLLPI